MSPKLHVAGSGEQKKHSNINYLAVATTRAMANIPALSGCQILIRAMFKVGI